MYKLEFTLADVHAHAAALAKLHPSSIPFSSFCFLVSSFSGSGLLAFLGSASYRLR
jgi:hypothetical protein